MSLKTWKAEFYPTPCNSVVTSTSAIRHSLRKWQGLTPENLEKHGCCISQEHADLVDKEDPEEWLGINGSSCSLCSFYEELCSRCDLTKHTRGKDCMAAGSAWMTWREEENPQPMIDLLTGMAEGVK